MFYGDKSMDVQRRYNQRGITAHKLLGIHPMGLSSSSYKYYF